MYVQVGPANGFWQLYASSKDASVHSPWAANGRRANIAVWSQRASMACRRKGELGAIVSIRPTAFYHRYFKRSMILFRVLNVTFAEQPSHCWTEEWASEEIGVLCMCQVASFSCSIIAGGVARWSVEGVATSSLSCVWASSIRYWSAPTVFQHANPRRNSTDTTSNYWWMVWDNWHVYVSTCLYNVCKHCPPPNMHAFR